MNRPIKFLDKAEEVLFIENNQSLASALGDGFNKLIDKYFVKQDERIFRKVIPELFQYFNEEAYGFSDLDLQTVINDLSLPKNNPLVKEYNGKQFSIRWMTLEDKDSGYLYFLIDPSNTIYQGVEQYLELGNYYRFAFTYENNDYLIILLKLK